MGALGLGPVGVSLSVADDESYLDHAVEVEKLGYGTIWVAGGQLKTLQPLTKLVRATSQIAVAPGIIPLDVYDSDEVAALYADLEGTDPGRLLVGLGGSQRVARPMQELEGFLDQLEAAQPPVPQSRRILAALGPRKLELARERFAGAVPLLVTPEYTRWARGVLGEEATLVVYEPVVLDDDPDRARSQVRTLVGFLREVGGYASNFTRMGYTDADVAELSDRLVDGVSAWGNLAAVEAQVREHLDAGADQVAISVLSDGDQPGEVEVARALAPRLIG